MNPRLRLNSGVVFPDAARLPHGAGADGEPVAGTRDLG
jgi:hypothetical protein